MKSIKGLRAFTLDVVGLVSSRKEESISDVKNHMDDGNLVEYIYEKYKDELSFSFDNSVYDNKVINQYFSDYLSSVHGNENSKYGIKNENDGLLLIIALATNEL